MVLPARLHGLRAERSNVPRDSAALYGAVSCIMEEYECILIPYIVDIYS